MECRCETTRLSVQPVAACASSYLLDLRSRQLYVLGAIEFMNYFKDDAFDLAVIIKSPSIKIIREGRGKNIQIQTHPDSIAPNHNIVSTFRIIEQRSLFTPDLRR